MHRVPLVRLEVQERAHLRPARVVDQPVDPPEGGDRVAHEAAGLLAVGQVGGEASPSPPASRIRASVRSAPSAARW